MSAWKDHLIKTDVDKLLEYIRAEEEVSLRDASSALGAENSTVLDWARSLEDAGIITIGYSARKGKMLRLNTDNEDIDATADEVKAEAGQKLWKARRWSKEQARLRRFEDALERLKEELEKDEKSAAKLRAELEDEEADLDDVMQSAEDIEEAEEELEELRSDLKDIKKDLSVLEKLEQHREAKASGGRFSGVIGAVKNALPFGGRDDIEYEALVDGTVDEVKETVREQDLDPEQVLDAEKEHKDRKTLKQWLEQRIDEDAAASDDGDNDAEWGENDVDYETVVVDGTVDEVKEAVREQDLDPETVLEAEREHKDRKTLVEWLERRIDDDMGGSRSGAEQKA